MRRIVWLPISALLFGLVIWRAEPWEVASRLTSVDLAPLAAALALNVAVVLLWAIRSRSLMQAAGAPLTVREAIPIVAFANTVNSLTPASSGEVLRALVLNRRHGVPYRASAAVILIERLWAMGMMLVTALAAAAGGIFGLQAPLTVVVWAAAAVAVFTPSLAYAAGFRPGPILRRMGARPDSHSRLIRLAHGMADVDDLLLTIVTDPRRAIVFVTTTALVFTCFALQAELVLVALGTGVGVLPAWGALGVATLAGIISALPFGLGTADLVLTLLLGVLGIAAGPAGAAVVLLRAVATLPLGVAGTVSWVWLSGARPADDAPSPTA